MTLKRKNDTLRLPKALRAGCAALSSRLRDYRQARNGRIELEKEFYRSLAAYCRVNNLPPMCEDDWKVASYSRDR